MSGADQALKSVFQMNKHTTCIGASAHGLPVTHPKIWHVDVFSFARGVGSSTVVHPHFLQRTAALGGAVSGKCPCKLFLDVALET